MKDFTKQTASTTEQKMIAELMDMLEKTTDKFIQKHTKRKDMSLPITLQNACLNYTSRMSFYLASMMPEKHRQLDYMETIRDAFNEMLNNTKQYLKSIPLESYSE